MLLDTFDQLTDLVFPRDCVGCGRPAEGAVFCACCRPAEPVRQVIIGGPFPVFTATSYGGPVRAALLRYKERGRRDLIRVLAQLLAGAVSALLRSGTSVPACRTVLVPVPSSRTASAARGGDHVVRLARRAGPQLGLPTARPLILTRAVRDSAGLAASDRAHNIGHAMAASRPPPGAYAAVIIDDIVTTGATLREAHRALRAVGWPVLGAAVVAATGRSN